MTVTIISGSPGAGKTSVAGLLATSTPDGVHLQSDSFFGFLEHRIDPSIPQSRKQNQTVVRVCALAAGEYAKGGYSVFWMA